MALTSNAAGRAGNGLGSDTQIISAAPADQAALDAFIAALGAAGHSIAGIDGAHGGTMHFAIQGGGTVANPTGAEATTAVCTFEE
jgi:hypothetical protein